MFSSKQETQKPDCNDNSPDRNFWHTSFGAASLNIIPDTSSEKQLKASRLAVGSGIQAVRSGILKAN
jgi:hypothetical protein